jgi:hypothetical protein
MDVLAASMPNLISRVRQLSQDLLIPKFHKVVGAATFDLLVILAWAAMNF